MSSIAILISAIKIIVLLGFVILIHECGHFFAARWCKVKVKEFAIGFGPVIWKKQTRETKYTLRLIPLGGFVNMVGEEERSDETGSFSKISIPKKILIILAGGIVNIIFGLLVYFILISSLGNHVSTTIESIEPGYAAELSGIKAEDKILKIDGEKIRLRNELNKTVNSSGGKELNIIIKRGNETKDISLVPTMQSDQGINVYYLGVNLKPAEKNFVNYMYYGFWSTVDFSVSIVDSLKLLFTGKVGVENLIGPVGISQVVSATEGFVQYIYIIAVISLSLGVTNLLPLPPLDGGKVVIYIIEAIRRKPMQEKVESWIQLTGFAFLIGLSIFVAYNDVLRIF